MSKNKKSEYEKTVKRLNNMLELNVLSDSFRKELISVRDKMVNTMKMLSSLNETYA